MNKLSRIFVHKFALIGICIGIILGIIIEEYFLKVPRIAFFVVLILMLVGHGIDRKFRKEV